MKTTVYAATGALLLLTVTACSSTPGTPTPAPSASSAAPASTTSNVPRVTSPLDATKYEQNPCALLSDAQGKQLINAVRNRQAAGTVAPICSWYDADGNRIGLGLLPTKAVWPAHISTRTASLAISKPFPTSTVTRRSCQERPTTGKAAAARPSSALPTTKRSPARSCSRRPHRSIKIRARSR